MKNVEYPQFQMAKTDEFGNSSVPISALLSGLHLNTSVCPSINLQQGNHQNPINSQELNNALLPGDENVSLFQQLHLH